MLEAFLWGLVASSSLILGGWLALRFTIPIRVVGLVMAFGAGVLISAVAYDLVLEAVDTPHGSGVAAAGLFSGAIVFAGGDELLERRAAARKRSDRAPEGSPLALVLGIVLDGVPESVVIGVSLLGGEAPSAAVVLAVLLSNLPESVAATSGLTRSGWRRGRILRLWALVVLVSALASLAGYALLDGTSQSAIAFVLAFAGGAILTMLAETMMPEAFEHAGRQVGLVTTLGFALAFGISNLD